ncbi:unnamed protein product [Fusarium graminearum]|uniref:Uncharacterized protein n=1 Tax=Gibberella zeae TaxID=5518 RepID=A0A4E9DQN6_GIBZA|nr:unnamed protein product [Fusarium graminearum]CAF3495418.1 unnamed protein product [Fusarium graminearum]CAG1976193.1 unnamed protein product [Fusarium graminearum]CAG1988053.1 unnamed protein product [Fusarium graminearum]
MYIANPKQNTVVKPPVTDFRFARLFENVTSSATRLSVLIHYRAGTYILSCRNGARSGKSSSPLDCRDDTPYIVNTRGLGWIYIDKFA